MRSGARERGVPYHHLELVASCHGHSGCLCGDNAVCLVCEVVVCDLQLYARGVPDLYPRADYAVSGPVIEALLLVVVYVHAVYARAGHVHRAGRSLGSPP